MHHDKPAIAISSCILGNRVRYDGEIKSYADICSDLHRHFELIAVCPEVEIGLSVPRPPVQLSGDIAQPRMTGRDNPAIDVTDAMRSYCDSKPRKLDNICGYVFKSRSPSCGIRNIPVFRNGEILADNRRGLFAQAMINTFPDLPVCDETDLLDVRQRTLFIEHALHYARQKNVRA